MIAQLLNREFLQKSIASLSQEIPQEIDRNQNGDEDALARAAQFNLSRDDLHEAEAAMQKMAQDGITAPVTAEDEQAFFPRDAHACLVQSAWQEFYESQKPEMIEADAARGAVGGEVIVSDQQLKGLSLTGDNQRGAFGIYDFVEGRDIGWVTCLFAEGLRTLRGKHPFNPQPAPPFTISNQARVLLVGDWGSGLPRAQKVSAAMRKVLDEPGPREQHVIHLGDVYYSGWPSEYEKRFLPHWPVNPGEEDRITSWSVNANHEMYSGGAGYFDGLLRDARFARQHQSSFFSLENDYWKILGLDTGYEDHDLTGGQATWVGQELAQTPQKQGILLSHHQLFSGFGESGGEKLAEKLQPVLSANRVRAWFWGHEHRCACYKPSHGIEYPRLIGHGGVPVQATSNPTPANVLYEYREFYKTLFEKWAYFGFVVLDFDDRQIHVRYINEIGYKHHEEDLYAQ